MGENFITGKIKKQFKGSSSQPDIKINSSIAINVTDLKHKINGLEHQLSEVNKHCQDLACSETSSRKDCTTLVETEDGTELASLKDQSEISSLKKSSTVETKLLYKTPEKLYKKSDVSGSSGKVYDDPTSRHTVTSNEMSTKEYASKEIKAKKRKNKLNARLKVVDGSQPNLRKHKTQSVYENFVSNIETSSYHSLIEPRISQGCSTAAPYPEKKHKHREYTEPLPTNKVRVKKCKDQTRRNSPENFVNREPKYKHKTNTSRDLDQDFIAEIIKRQYRPVKMFGKRESGMSQISAPVCRDHEFTIRDDILEGSELCSCCIDERKKRQYRYEHQVKDKRSVCDARLYSSKKHMRHRLQQKDVYPKYNDIYNDSEQYDLIPVKEKSSPKSRRRLLGDPNIPYNYYKEVPPSPRTQRPRLNLKASNIDTEFEDYMMQRKEFKRRNYSPYRHRKYLEDIESAESLDMMDYYKAKYKSDIKKRNKTEKHVQYESGIVNSLAPPRYQNEHNNITNDNPLNKTQDSDTSGDKTDKALSEIKDILQSFLQEIKKESSGSQCGNSDIMTTKAGEKGLNEFRPSNTKLNTSIMPESGLCVNSFGIPQNNMPSPFMSPFTNPCCYPILPVCPMNCMQSGLLLPTPSCTCNCANRSKDGVQPDQQLSNESNGTKTCTETEQLIKEIYKVVAQNPNRDLQNDYKERKEETSPKETMAEKNLTSRSAGDSLRHSKHDAQVATHKVKCHSRSCEAIGSRETSDTYYSRTNPTYSDTMIERLSLEVTEASSETETSSRVTDDRKVLRQNKIAKVLRSFGLFKKKKDVIEEVSESESTVEVSIEAKPPPFRQEITDYAMHSQEYYQRPPIPTGYNHYHASSMDYRHGYGTPPHCHHHDCPAHTSPRSSSMYDSNDNHRSHRCRPGSPYRSPRPHPSAPPYPNPYDHNHHHSQPQVPLCLKEIEVKSIATQSDRKLPFFWKLGRKMQAPVAIQRIDENPAKNTFTQTQTAEKAKPKLMPTSKLTNINWKALQAKVNEIDQPNTFSFKTQKKLAEGDIKMRNAMLKKIFYKKNPFSPRNIIVRTILGKDKSSYGDPPMIYRPKMFL